MAMAANIKIERNYILSVSLYPQDFAQIPDGVATLMAAWT
jgi:hypothetical protein